MLHTLWSGEGHFYQNSYQNFASGYLTEKWQVCIYLGWSIFWMSLKSQKIRMGMRSEKYYKIYLKSWKADDSVKVNRQLISWSNTFFYDLRAVAKCNCMVREVFQYIHFARVKEEVWLGCCGILQCVESGHQVKWFWGRAWLFSVMHVPSNSSPVEWLLFVFGSFSCSDMRSTCWWRISQMWSKCLTVCHLMLLPFCHVEHSLPMQPFSEFVHLWKSVFLTLLVRQLSFFTLSFPYFLLLHANSFHGAIICCILTEFHIIWLHNWYEFMPLEWRLCKYALAAHMYRKSRLSNGFYQWHDLYLPLIAVLTHISMQLDEKHNEKHVVLLCAFI